MKLLTFSVLFLIQQIVTSTIVINTWSGDFEGATYNAFEKLLSNGTALDAVETGCTFCEEHQCDTTVGYGNHPDSTGETSLDAMIMDGNTMDMGCVGYLRHHRKAVSIARAVMFYTDNTMLVGDGAEEFATMMGFPIEPATNANSRAIYDEWKVNNCQPNFWNAVAVPESKSSCGPYQPSSSYSLSSSSPSNHHHLWQANKQNHDTIGMVVIDSSGSLACGTSTNGASHKIKGRIGDSPIPGSGCYVNSQVGGAAATGDGDVMMRFLPSITAVNLMEAGYSPTEACQMALNKINKVFPAFAGGMVCVNKYGKHGGAANNMNFSYSYMIDGMTTVTVVSVN
jgi:N4-(beta-N-acetylglucosaminyl)-L-asparaginase